MVQYTLRLVKLHDGYVLVKEYSGVQMPVEQFVTLDDYRQYIEAQIGIYGKMWKLEKSNIPQVFLEAFDDNENRTEG